MLDFHKILTDWYKQNKRDLPWRMENNPYYVWVSEIILQQTRVDQGKAYFIRFISRFPDVQTLAASSENDVLKMWQGLGYYSRARNIHYAAKQIQNECEGKFPENFDQIIKLKGVGNYTAAAIASISFGKPIAAIDGNVYRVLSRWFGIRTPIDSTEGKKQFTEMANAVLDSNNPGLFNEAMMEFGALQCVPKNPDCGSCPFNYKCVAFNENTISFLPVKSKKVKVKQRYFNYLYIKYNDYIFLEQRTAKDIWHNMYQLPLIETIEPCTPEQLLAGKAFKAIFINETVTIDSVTPEIIHILTHQRLHVRFISIGVNKEPKGKALVKIAMDELSEYPIPKVIDNFLKQVL